MELEAPGPGQLIYNKVPTLACHWLVQTAGHVGVELGPNSPGILWVLKIGLITLPMMLTLSIGACVFGAWILRVRCPVNRTASFQLHHHYSDLPAGIYLLVSEARFIYAAK